MSEELPTPPQIALNPEIVLLLVLDFALDASVRALVAAHPELDGDEQPYLENQPTQYALRIVGQIWRLKHALLRYRELISPVSARELERDPQETDTSW